MNGTLEGLTVNDQCPYRQAVKDGSLSEEQYVLLHRFFGPWRIPLGITDDQITILSFLIEKKMETLKSEQDRRPQTRMSVSYQKDSHNATAYVDVPEFLCFPLIPEFSPDEAMTAERFIKGVARFLRITQNPDELVNLNQCSRIVTK